MLRHLGLVCLLYLFIVTAAKAVLIAHYPFDVADDSTSPDLSSDNFVTLGPAASLTPTAQVGSGALEMDGSLWTPNPGDGAVTSNDFSWNVDTRTISFWLNGPGVDDLGDILYARNNQAFVSMGLNESGQRFSTKTQSNTANLRVEIQGTGTDMGVVIADQTWHHVAVVVPNDNALFADIIPYVDGIAVDNPSDNTLEINTATAPMHIGEEMAAFPDRVATGLIDDVAVWDDPLSPDEIGALIAVSTSTALNGNASVFNAAKGAHDGGPEGAAAFEGLVWRHADGLSATPIISGSGTEFTVVLDPAAGTGAVSSAYQTGDVNLDGVVDNGDLDIIGLNFRQQVGSLTDGDLNADGVVNFGDFRIWKDHSTAPASAAELGIPEPGTALLMTLLTTVCLVYRKLHLLRRTCDQA